MRLAVRSAISEKARPASEFDREAPHQNASRGKLDQAVNPERRETDAVRRYTRSDGDYGLDRHPCDREPTRDGTPSG